MFRLLPFVMLVCLFALDCLLPSGLLADYYKYTDGRGVVNISNNLDSVPAKHRSKMKVVREEPKKEQLQAAEVQAPGVQAEAAASGREQASVAASESEPESRVAEIFSRFPWLKPLAYIAGIVALFLIIAELTSKLSSPHLSKVIYISFFMGVMVFLYKNYVEHIVASTTKVKDAAVSMMKKSSNREIPLPDEEAPPAQK